MQATYYNKLIYLCAGEMELDPGNSGGIIPRSLGEYVKQPFTTDIFVADCDIYRRVHALGIWKSIATV